MSDKDKIYSPEEERLNIISHAIGIAGAVAVGAYFLSLVIAKSGDAWDIASIILYIIGMLGSFICSTAYHSAKPGTPSRLLLRKFDHSAIYWYIAGCYSPITLIAMRDVGYWGWGIFIFCWLCAIIGTFVSVNTMKKHNRIETLCYVLMGLTIVVAMKQFYDAVPLFVFLWVVGEGVAYIIGAVLYSLHKVKYIHAVFHLFVLVGTVCHMLAVWKILEMM
jgi:hemolysin III